MAQKLEQTLTDWQCASGLRKMLRAMRGTESSEVPSQSPRPFPGPEWRDRVHAASRLTVGLDAAVSCAG